jgi:hypothetical protein
MKLKFSYSALAVFVLFGAICFFSTSSLSATGSRAAQKGKICSDPSVPCRTSITFEAYDLPFRVPKDAVISETEEFYAIILQSVRHAEGDCGQFVSEAERLSAQEMFPHSKVFTSRCGNPGGLFYTNVADNTEFMAVYAGATKAQADRMLATVKASGKYSGANIRRMSAGFNGT